MKLTSRCVCLVLVLLLPACGKDVSAQPSAVHRRTRAVEQLLPSDALRPGTSLEGLPFRPPRSADEAVAVFRRQLVRDHQGQFRFLVTRQTLLDAIRSAEQGYEERASYLRSELRGNYYQQNVDLMAQITHGGRWPRGAYLSAFYELTDADGMSYHGIGVRLIVRDPLHPSRQLIGSSWPILDLWYGHGG